MKKTTFALYFLATMVLLLVFACASPAAAQGDNSLVLRLSRDFGYSSGTGQIQGTFTIKVSGPANLSRVDFLIDGNKIGEADGSPFNLQFTTSSFSLGSHTISAVGYTSDGQELHTTNVTAEFVSANDSMQATGRILIPILVILGVALLVSFVFPALSGRGKMSQLPLGEPRNYGFKGGGICPKCRRPFSFSFLSVNLPFIRLDRCPYCGRWGFVRIASLNDLRKAEAAELEQAKASQAIPEESEEDKLRKELDDSRFQGG